MDSLTDQIMSLEFEHSIGYGKRQIPDELDERIERILKDWVTAPASDRAEALSIISLNLARKFQTYAGRMAALAVRKQDAGHIRNALLAYGLAGNVDDFRDRVPVLSLLNRSAELLNLSLQIEFSRVASDLPDFSTPEVNQFIDREPRDKTIGVMHFIESMDESGFTYERLW